MKVADQLWQGQFINTEIVFINTIKPNYTILIPFVPQFGDCVTQNVKVKDYTAVEEGRKVVGYTGRVRPNA